MGQPYVGEIRMFGGNFAPLGWAFCNGAQMSISENEILFQLIGTTYGGDGMNYFNLPDLQGRSPMHQTSGFTIGQKGGEESVTLTSQQAPVHSHAALGSEGPGSSASTQGNVLASLPAGTTFAYGNVAPYHALDPSSIGPVGGSQPHENRQPFLAVSFIISLFGVYPTPT